MIDEQINSVRRELLNLDSVGIIKNETFDNKVYYSANMKHPYSKPLVDLFTVKVDNSKERDIHKSGWDEYIKPVKSYLKAMVVTNRMPGEEGVDLFIVGDDKTKKLTHWAEVVEKKQGKPINYVIMSEDDYSYRKSVKDRFLIDLMRMDIMETYDPERILLKIK